MTRTETSPDTDTKTRPRIFIVEDHDRLRNLLTTFLRIQTDLECCGSAETAEEALAALEASRPDLIMADLSLPGMSGIELVRELKTKHPGVQCMILSGHKEPQYAHQALEAGARGYVLKGNPVEIADSIRRCCQGETVVSPEVS